MDPDLHVTEDLSAYLANELDQNERSRVELHLRDCEACRKELDKHTRLNEVLANSTPISPSNEILRGVMQQVQRDEKSNFNKRVLPWLAIAAVLAAALFLLKIRKETPVPDEVVEKNPPVIKPINPLPVPKESPQTKIETPPPIVKSTPPKEPIVKPEPETIPEEPPQIVQQLNPQLTPEDSEVISQIDELENMDVISNYENLENLEVAIMDEGGGNPR
jgi:hypothetical protein